MFRKNAFSTILAIGALLAITLGLLIISKPVQAKGDKIEICHLPPGNPDNYHTIDISMKAWDAHQKHGDITGACDGLCNILCDDGDACTVDDYEVGCQDLICPIVRDPVDCNDGDPLTNDSCDSSSGCINECIDGYVRDPQTNECVEDNPEPVDCLCFTAGSLNSFYEDNFFTLESACPETIEGTTDGVIIDFFGGSACTGPGCNVNQNPGISGCLIPGGGYQVFGLDDADPAAQHEACTAEIEQFCDSLNQP